MQWRTTHSLRIDIWNPLHSRINTTFNSGEILPRRGGIEQLQKDTVAVVEQVTCFGDEARKADA